MAVAPFGAAVIAHGVGWGGPAPGPLPRRGAGGDVL